MANYHLLLIALIRLVQDNRALFLLSVSKFDVEVLDFELLVYHIFSVSTLTLLRHGRSQRLNSCRR